MVPHGDSRIAAVLGYVCVKVQMYQWSTYLVECVYSLCYSFVGTLLYLALRLYKNLRARTRELQEHRMGEPPHQQVRHD